MPRPVNYQQVVSVQGQDAAGKKLMVLGNTLTACTGRILQGPSWPQETR